MKCVRLNEMVTALYYDEEHEEWHPKVTTIEDVLSVCDDYTVIDAVPVRHGKWKQWDAYGFEDTYECTACGEQFVFIEGTPFQNGFKYCPHCGAIMGSERRD